MSPRQKKSLKSIVVSDTFHLSRHHAALLGEGIRHCEDDEDDDEDDCPGLPPSDLLIEGDDPGEDEQAETTDHEVLSEQPYEGDRKDDDHNETEDGTGRTGVDPEEAREGQRQIVKGGHSASDGEHHHDHEPREHRRSPPCKPGLFVLPAREVRPEEHEGYRSYDRDCHRDLDWDARPPVVRCGS